MVATLILASGCEVTRLPDSAAEPDATQPAIAPSNGDGPNTDGDQPSTDGGDLNTGGQEPGTDRDNSSPSPFRLRLPDGPSGPVDAQRSIYSAILRSCDSASGMLAENEDDLADVSSDHVALWQAAIAACRGDEELAQQLFAPVRGSRFTDFDACVVHEAVASALDRHDAVFSPCFQFEHRLDSHVATTRPTTADDADPGISPETTELDE